jgi:hypothetical protein
MLYMAYLTRRGVVSVQNFDRVIEELAADVKAKKKGCFFLVKQSLELVRTHSRPLHSAPPPT